MSTSAFCEVSPSAEIVAHDDILIPSSETLNNLGTRNFISKYSFPIEIDLAPKEEELLFVVMLNISVNQAIPLIVFVNHIQGFSIPGSESSPFPIFNIIPEYSEKLCGFAFKIAHLPCCAGDFLECKFLLTPQILIHNLVQQFGNKNFHVLFV